MWLYNAALQKRDLADAQKNKTDQREGLGAKAANMVSVFIKHDAKHRTALSPLKTQSQTASTNNTFQ